MILNIDFALKLSDYTSWKRFICLKWILIFFWFSTILQTTIHCRPLLFSKNPQCTSKRNNIINNNKFSKMKCWISSDKARPLLSMNRELLEIVLIVILNKYMEGGGTTILNVEDIVVFSSYKNWLMLTFLLWFLKGSDRQCLVVELNM